MRNCNTAKESKLKCYNMLVTERTLPLEMAVARRPPAKSLAPRASSEESNNEEEA